MQPQNTYIFAYGSLLDHFQQHSVKNLQPALLQGYRREWNVAMSNSIDIPGYRYFIDPETNERPDIYVTFLNIITDNRYSTNGLLIPASPTDLATIDNREKNYDRIEVTASVNPLPSGSIVYSYIGKPQAIARFKYGHRQDKATISKTYLEKVTAGFKAIASDELASFHNSTSEHTLPVRNLLEIKLG